MLNAEYITVTLESGTVYRTTDTGNLSFNVG